MTVLICMAMVILLHMMLAVTDRGNREHWKYRGPWGRKQYWALMESLDDRGIPGKQTLVEGYGTLGRVLLIGMTYWQVTAYTFAAWLGIQANPSSAGFWGACLLSAVLIAFQSLMRPLRLVGAKASASNPGESTKQRLVLFAARLCAVPVVTMALAVLFADVNTMRTWLVRSVSGISADSDKVLAELQDEVIAAAAAVLVLLISAMAYAIVRMGNRLVVAGTPDVFRRQADESCYLYLRSFNDDNISMQSPLNDSGLRSLLWPRIGFEELLALLMNASVGRLITIGHPTERLPRVGAYRNYFNEDEWREGIRVTAERVRGIVLTVGATESLAWEVRHLKEWVCCANVCSWCRLCRRDRLAPERNGFCNVLR